MKAMKAKKAERKNLALTSSFNKSKTQGVLKTKNNTEIKQIKTGEKILNKIPITNKLKLEAVFEPVETAKTERCEKNEGMVSDRERLMANKSNKVNKFINKIGTERTEVSEGTEEPAKTDRDNRNFTFTFRDHLNSFSKPIGLTDRTERYSNKANNNACMEYITKSILNSSPNTVKGKPVKRVNDSKTKFSYELISKYKPKVKGRLFSAEKKEILQKTTTANLALKTVLRNRERENKMKMLNNEEICPKSLEGSNYPKYTFGERLYRKGLVIRDFKDTKMELLQKKLIAEEKVEETYKPKISDRSLLILQDKVIWY